MFRLYSCLDFIYFVVAQMADGYDHGHGNHEKGKAVSRR